MKKKKIRSQIKTDSKQAKRSLRGFIKKDDQDKLHKFRVGIKKLRAVASLIEKTSTHTDVRRELKPLKGTYQLSGQVRDSYLHAKLAENMEIVDTEYLAKEKLVMKKAARRLRKDRHHHFKILRRVESRLLKRIPKLKGNKLESFYKSELLGIGECLSVSTGDEQMHDCRKRLKVLLYNLPLVATTLDTSVNEDYLQQVQAAIGDWHDHVLAAGQFPGLGDKSEELIHDIKILTENFYERATTDPRALIESAS